MRFMIIMLLIGVMGALVSLGAMDLSTHQVMLALPIRAYGHPECPAEDSTHPRGCVWHGDEATWVVYP